MSTANAPRRRFRTLTGRPLTALALALALGPAQAESWYRWLDREGAPQLTRERPPLGLVFTEVVLPDPVPWRSAPAQPAELPAGAEPGAQKLFREASRSVYRISSRPRSRPLGDDGARFGTAVAVSDDTLLTNCHIVAAADHRITIGSSGKDSDEDAELVAADFAADRCVVRTRGLRLEPVAGVRSWESLEVGEAVYAIGNPRSLARTMSEGLVSGKRLVRGSRWVQTTAPISPGSSGGGLFDQRGNLVGITTGSLRDAQGINFAIAADEFWR
jgi:serine protease Do